MKKSYPDYKKEHLDLWKNITSEERKALEEYRIILLSTAKEAKVTQKLRVILQFRDVIEKSLLEITTQDLQGFWSVVNSSEHEYNYKVMIRKFVKAFVLWKYKKEIKRDKISLDGLNVGDFKANRKKISKNVLFKPEEIQRMLHKAESLRDKALIILMYETAARPQEIRDLRWRDINFSDEEVHLDSSKTEKSRDLPIKESIVHLKRWRQEWAYPDVTEEDYVFPNYQDRKASITTEWINTLVKSIANKSGITRGVTSYTLRHTRLTDIYRLGVKGIEHNKFAGHKEGSKQQTTYAHIDNEDMKEDVLSKVYHVKEYTPEQRKELERQVTELTSKVAVMSKALSNLGLEIDGKIIPIDQWINKKSKLVSRA